MITPEDIQLVRFERTRRFETGYREHDVDRFLDQVEDTLEQLARERRTQHGDQAPQPTSAWPQTLSPVEIRNVAFSKPPMGMRGYNEDEVDQFLDDVEATVRQLRERLSKYEEI